MANELMVLLTAMAPISELRGAIPLGLEVLNFSISKTLFLAILGNFLPVPILIYLLEPAEKFLRRNKRFNAFFDWLYKRTRHKFEGNYLKWGELALAVFVGIPLPATGAWSGVAAAHIFGIPKKRAMIFIFFGILLAAAIVTILDLGIAGWLKLL